jgi:large subunit ribosomal protein L15
MLNKLKSPKYKQKSKQVGRGIGSGVGGHTTGRGQKGQKSRSGYSRPRKFFEGGTNPLIKRLPKLKGFSRRSITSKTLYIRINLDTLNKLKDGTKITLDNVKELGLVTTNSKQFKVKVLSNGKIEKKIILENIPCSDKAKVSIEKAGGSVSIK